MRLFPFALVATVLLVLTSIGVYPQLRRSLA
jgi:hypothetical protein